MTPREIGRSIATVCIAIVVSVLARGADASSSSAGLVWRIDGSLNDFEYTSTALSPAGRGVTKVTPSSIDLLDVFDGSMMWSFRNGTKACTNAVFTDDGTVLLATCDAGTVALDVATGHLLWSSEIGAKRKAYRRMVVDSASRRAVAFAESTVCFDVDTGDLVWTSNVVASGDPGLVRDGAGDTVLVIPTQANATALSLSNGTVMWHLFPTSIFDARVSHVDVSSVAVNPSRTVAFVTVSNLTVTRIAAYRIADRSVLWTFDPDDGFPGTPTADARFMYVTGGTVSDDMRRLSFNYLFAVDLITGNLAWQFKVDNMVKSPAISDGKSVVFAAGFHDIVSLNTSTGELGWKVDAGGLIARISVSSTSRTIVGGGLGTITTYLVSPPHGTPRGKLIGIGIGVGVLLSAMLGAAGLVVHLRRRGKRQGGGAHFTAF